MRAVLAVGDYQVEIVLLPKFRHENHDRLAARFAHNVADEEDYHFAYSTQRVSRTTVTLIWPGYCSSPSIFLLMLRASAIASPSLILPGSTKTRISRPAWSA